MRYRSIDSQLFVQNRANLAKLLLPNSLAVINANDLLPTNADATLPLRQSSDLFYLTGVAQEETILLLYPEAHDEKFREILFLRETSDLIATWEGHKLAKEEARKVTGIQRVEWLTEFRPIFHRLMCECGHVYLNSNEHKRAVIEVETREARFVADTLKRYPLHDFQRLARIMHRLRAVKSPLEIELLRAACFITKAGFERVCKFVRPGVNEMEIEAEFAHEFIRRGGGFAYTPIIASGANACVLHYIENDQPCRKGDLLLLDVGASYANYNADLTRTIPVSGRFTRRQRQVYNAVLRVLRATSAAAVPGKFPKDWQKEAEQFVEKELVDLGLLKMSEIKKQDPDKPAFKKYFMHGVGHPLGLDVHDVGLTVEPIQAGWLLTVEPAIYIKEEGFAVRLENDILVQAGGNVDLLADIPLEADEVEQLMRR
ncbi:MAG: aminopeptidase P N-terminal domain-containing protein [Verrucomicrobia bacterium]|nr:aminopeptidase P N-terminal domain-containing protein [Verrucomicrobiota bacterium]